jgi:hypothetical protein
MERPKDIMQMVAVWVIWLFVVWVFNVSASVGSQEENDESRTTETRAESKHPQKILTRFSLP